MKRGVATILCAVFIACGAQVVIAADSPQPSTAPEQRIESGPVRVHLRVDRSRINVAQDLRAEITVEAPADVQIDLPAPVDRLGEFTLSSVKDIAPEVKATAQGLVQILRRVYALEPYLPGAYSLPELEVRWKVPGTSQAGLARTAPVKIEVVSLAPGPQDKHEPPDTGTIRDAYTLPEPPKGSTVPALFGALVAVCAGLGAGWWLRARSATTPSTALLAVREIEQLAASVGPSVGPEQQHAAAGAIRRALGAGIGPGLAAASADELRSRLGTGFSSTDAETLASTLGELDASRYAGRSVSGSELAPKLKSAAEALRNLLAGQQQGRAA